MLGTLGNVVQEAWVVTGTSGPGGICGSHLFPAYGGSGALFTTHSNVLKLRLRPAADGLYFGEKEEERLKMEVRGPRGRLEFPRVELCVCDVPGMERRRSCITEFEGLPGSALPSRLPHLPLRAVADRQVT